MKKMMLLMLTLFMLLGVASMNAQVTIGTDHLPHAGAVLDLQSTTQGLKLPNVALNADPTVFVLPETSADTKALAVGMVVYNTANVGQGPGIYAWDGAKWLPIGSNPCTSVTDIDGNIYPAKMFGTQCWMTKNLRVSRQYNGAEFVRGNTDVATDDSVRVNPGYDNPPGGVIVSVHGNGGVVAYRQGSPGSVPAIQYSVSTTGNPADGVLYTPDYEAFVNTFGFMYTYQQAMTACPQGWHLPSMSEFDALCNTLGPLHYKKMKANNYSYLANGADDLKWRNWGGYPPGDPKNSGFDLLPSGCGLTTSQAGFGRFAILQLSTLTSLGDVYYHSITNTEDDYAIAAHAQNGQYPVRCVRN
jgi:uncharacterized protein (TIGR02145 family)